MEENPGRIIGWLGFLSIRTLEGDMAANAGDYIIKGVKGEVYPCKPDIFTATYEPVYDAAVKTNGESNG